MNLLWLAHADELHTEETSNLTHWLGEWWAALGLYLIFLWLIFFVFKNRIAPTWRLGVVLGVSLVVGLLFYRWTPLLSGVALTFGFACSLVLSLGSIKKDQ